MDNFEKLIAELVNTEGTKKKEDLFGDAIGEERKIVVGYRIGKEEDSKIVQECYNKKSAMRDALSLMFAASNTISANTGIDAKRLASAMLEPVVMMMVNQSLKVMKEGLL